jgi:hypothetical protein
MQTSIRPRMKGLTCGFFCLLFPLAILPPDGEFDTVASWYGPGFQGRKTASGERFDTNKMTAASRTLPFGTRVLVKNPRNGRVCEVTINDRGPYVRGRDIDLSHAAAQKLGISGIGHVICYTGGARQTVGIQSQAKVDATEDSDSSSSADSPGAVDAPSDVASTPQSDNDIATIPPALQLPSPDSVGIHSSFHPRWKIRNYSKHISSRHMADTQRLNRSQQYVAYHQPIRLKPALQYVAYNQPGRSAHPALNLSTNRSGNRVGKPVMERSQRYVAYHQPSANIRSSKKSNLYVAHLMPKPAPNFRRHYSRQYIASAQTPHPKFNRAINHLGHGLAHLYRSLNGLMASI